LPPLPRQTGAEPPRDTALASEPASASPAQRIVPSPPPPSSPSQSKAGFRYFQSHELTQQASLDVGLAGGDVLVVPGVAPQSATVRVALDEQGNVDAVTFEDSNLTDEEKRLVEDELRRRKFLPGKIGRIPVRTEVTKGIKLDSEARS